jgi:hypothetical protein
MGIGEARGTPPGEQPLNLPQSGPQLRAGHVSGSPSALLLYRLSGAAGAHPINFLRSRLMLLKPPFLQQAEAVERLLSSWH